MRPIGRRNFRSGRVIRNFPDVASDGDMFAPKVKTKLYVDFVPENGKALLCHVGSDDLC